MRSLVCVAGAGGIGGILLDRPSYGEYKHGRNSEAQIILHAGHIAAAVYPETVRREVSY